MPDSGDFRLEPPARALCRAPGAAGTGLGTVPRGTARLWRAAPAGPHDLEIEKFANDCDPSITSRIHRWTGRGYQP
jgi:hypothetical protein